MQPTARVIIYLRRKEERFPWGKKNKCSAMTVVGGSQAFWPWLKAGRNLQISTSSALHLTVRLERLSSKQWLPFSLRIEGAS